MDEIKENVTRRNLFVVGGLGAVAMAGLVGTAYAATDTSSVAEKANVKLVEHFVNSWNEPDRGAGDLAPDASVRMEEDKPAIIGSAAVAAAFNTGLKPGQKVLVKIHSTFAKGPLVVTMRTDTLTTPGGADQVYKIVGVFVIKGGKIKEWTDYLDV